MLGHLRDRTGAHRALAVLALLALALKIVFPPGFMPGSGFAHPIVICTGQGPAMMMLDAAGHPQPAMPAHHADHPCAFAGHGAPPLAPDLSAGELARSPVAPPVVVADVPSAAPGRGMAAPPPPSHAPPLSRA